MKKLLLFMLLATIGISGAYAQSKVAFRESQARVLEPSQNVYVKPLIAEIQIIKDSFGEESRIRDSIFFSNEEINALSGEISNIKSSALFKSSEKHKADIIVGAIFDIKSNQNGKGYDVIVYGYPAIYKGWRTAVAGDYEWIRLEKTITTNEKEKVQAVIKSK